MPLRQYFVWVGSILLVMLFAADWCFPAPVAHAPHSEIPPNQRINLRIHSDHKRPERVVFDTTRSRLTAAAGVSPKPDVLPSPNVGQAEQHGPLEAFAAMPVHDRDEQTLLRELTHRIRNELVSSISIVSAAAVRTENPEVKVALSNVVELPEQHADVHRLLTTPDRGGLVDAVEYIRKLGFAMSRPSLEPMGIRLMLVADTLPLESERCWRLALAVHEIVTNAARHACFDGRDGAIKIKLSLADTMVNCIVADNGSLPARLKPARGLQVVSDLTKSLGGRIEYSFGPQFSSFLLVFPLTERERRANRVVAARRARGARLRKAMPPLSRSQAASAHSDRAGGGQENLAASELATEPAADAPVCEMENG